MVTGMDKVNDLAQGIQTHFKNRGIKLGGTNLEVEEIGHLKIIETFGHHKSILFKEINSNEIIKVYHEISCHRKLEDIVQSYIHAWKENPDMFPRAEKIGEGKLYMGKNSYDLIVIRQQFIENAENGTLRCFLEKDYDERAIELCLDKWDRLIDRHRTSPPLKLLKILERVEEKDFESFKKITDEYYDGFANLQASFAIEKLKKMGKLRFLNGLEFPRADINVSKIVGDISPKHLIVGGNYLSVDAEKYGLGDPSRDLATFIRYFIGKDHVKKILKQIGDRYGGATLKNSFLNLIGDRARIVLYPLRDSDLDKNMRNFREDLSIYQLIKKYW